MPKFLEQGKKAIEHIGYDPKGKRTIELPQYNLVSNGRNKEIVKAIPQQQMDFVVCPSGSIVKKICISNQTKKRKRDLKIEITKPFLIGTTPITQGVWEYVMGYNPAFYQNRKMDIFIVKHRLVRSSRKKDNGQNVDYPERHIEIKPNLNRPIESITWFDALTFCNKLSTLQNLETYYNILDPICSNEIEDFSGWGKKTKHKKIVHAEIGINPNANGYRLPTLSEWDFIKSMTTNVQFDDDILHLTKFKDEDFYVKPVASNEPNELGLYDVNENVFEMLYDHQHIYMIEHNLIHEKDNINAFDIFNLLGNKKNYIHTRNEDFFQRILATIKKNRTFKDPTIAIQTKIKALEYINNFLVGNTNDLYSIHKSSVFGPNECDKYELKYNMPNANRYRGFFDVGFRVVRNIDIEIDAIHKDEEMKVFHKKQYRLDINRYIHLNCY